MTEREKEREDRPLIGGIYDGGTEIITPDDGFHYFFGYYDMRATQKSGRHLCHRVGFMDRLPVSDDVCEVGWLEDRVFHKIGETTAWNFQQGAMLQYHPTLPDTVFYNIREDGVFRTVTQNFATGERKLTDRATACVSPDGRWGLAVHFGRIYDFRPGYGYAGCPDDNATVNAPTDDGVFLVDIDSGISRQILNYRDLAPVAGFDADDKILVNHITFNPSSDRFVMLVRSFPRAGRSWTTSMVIGDPDGNAYTVLKNTYVSHYCWCSPDKIVAHCTVGGGDRKSMYRINIRSGDAVEYDMPYFHSARNGDIHCNLSPRGEYIIGDGYDLDGYRRLMAYRVSSGKSVELFRVRTVHPPVVDVRCDLHARFVFGGKTISFDTTQNGRREIATVPAKILNF